MFQVCQNCEDAIPQIHHGNMAILRDLLRDTDGVRLWFSVNLFPPYPEYWIQNMITVLYNMEPEMAVCERNLLVQGLI